MKKPQLINSDVSKKVYKSDREDQLIIEFLDDNPFKKGKKKKIPPRGECNNSVSALLFEYLESYHVATYFIKKSDAKEMIVKNYEPIPIKIIIRNIATETLRKTYGIPKGEILEYPVIEYYLKDPKHHNPLVNEYHIYALNHANPEEMKTISRISSKVNAILKSFFKRRNLKLVDIKLEFGRIKEKITICDEITPETFRIWDALTDERYDFEIMEKKPNTAEQIYKKIMKKINILK